MMNSDLGDIFDGIEFIIIFFENLYDNWYFAVIIAGLCVTGLFAFKGVMWKFICSLYLVLFVIFYSLLLAITF